MEEKMQETFDAAIHAVRLPNPQGQKVRWSHMVPLSRLWRELRAYRKLTVITQAVCILAIVMGMAVPFTLKYVTERIEAGQVDILLWAPSVGFGIALLLGLVHLLRAFLTQYITLRMSKDLQVRIYSKFMNQDIREHFKTPVGEKVSRITFDIQWFTQGAGIFLSETFYTPLMVLISLGIMFYLDWRLALVTLCLTPLSLLAGKSISRRLSESTRLLQQQNARLTRHITDTLRGMLLVKIFGREAREQDMFDRLLERQMHTSVQNSLWGGIFSLTVDMGNTAVVCLIGWLAYYLASKEGGLSIATLVAFASVTYFFFAEVSRVGNTMAVLARAAASCERIFRLLDSPEQPAAAGGAPAGFQHEIRFEKVSFAYEEELVLKDVSFSIKKGEKVALVGMSGAGKSTLIRLMVGLLQPRQGIISLDGVPLNEIDPAVLKSLFGYSPQTTFLFFNTLLENIRYSRTEATPAEVEQAARTACAHDFIERLPAKYDSIAGEEGAQLSEGQKQRVAIARALLKNAPIVILDESCAQVDVITENRIYQNLIQDDGLTLVLISHRPTVLKNASRILMLSNGGLQEIEHPKEALEEDTLKNLLEGYF